MTFAPTGPARQHNWLSNAGLIIMAVAFVWWFLFYAQWTGPLRLLDLKVPCLVSTIDECSFFQARLGEFHASGPAYQPAAWWIGMATFLTGRFSGKIFSGKLSEKLPGKILGRAGKEDGAGQ
jgi:hypothetical protein